MFLQLYIVLASSLVVWAERECNWPSNEELQTLGGSLSGDILYPGSTAYTKAATMKNVNFNKKPGAIVMVESKADVQKALAFAHEKNLPVSVQSSGHDYNGRSTRDGSFHIDLSRMEDITVNLNDTNSDTGSSAWLEPGCQMIKAYKEADKYDKLILGGNHPTVCAGGYYSGGGHSVQTVDLGLGADNVIQVEMVAMDGSIVLIKNDTLTITDVNGTTTTEADTDLFWSVRGGGGSFGVIVGYKVKLHDAPSSGFIQLGITWMLQIYYDPEPQIDELVRGFSEIFLREVFGVWGGYIIADNVHRDGPYGTWSKGFFSIYLLFKGNMSDARPAINALEALKPERRLVNFTKHYENYLEYAETVNDPTGSRVLLSGRFLVREDLEDPTGLIKVISKMWHMEGFAGCTGIILGGKARSHYDESCVSDDFHNGLISWTPYVGWADPSHDPYYEEQIQDLAQVVYDNVGKGTYYNEPDYYLDSWKNDFWGDETRYSRLLRTKKKWDKNGQIMLHHGVGADDAEYLKKAPSCRASNTMIQPGVLVMFIITAWFLKA